MPINKRITELTNFTGTIADADVFTFVQGGVNYKIPWSVIKNNVDDDFARLDGADVINNATGAAFVSGSFAGTIQPTTLSANRTYTLPDTTGNVVLDSVGYTFSQAQTFSAVVTFSSRPVLAPVGTSSGDGGGIQLRELVANGSNFIGIQAPDALAANVEYILPSAVPGSGNALTWGGAFSGGTYVLVWTSPWSIFAPVGTSPGDGGRVALQELAANGSEVVRLVAPDSIPTSYSLTLPSALPIIGADNVLLFNTTGVGRFGKVSSGIFNSFSSF